MKVFTYSLEQLPISKLNDVVQKYTQLKYAIDAVRKDEDTIEIRVYYKIVDGKKVNVTESSIVPDPLSLISEE